MPQLRVSTALPYYLRLSEGEYPRTLVLLEHN